MTHRPSPATNPTYDQPAAYDVQGRPLYYRPEAAATPPSSAVNASDELPPELQAEHDDSVRLYPEIQFSKTEYVVIDVQRTIWGLVIIWLVAVLAFVAISIFATIMSQMVQVDPFVMFLIIAALGVICLAGGMVGQWVYHQNFFVVTNERAILKVQSTPFSHHYQNIEIEHIEDCSYHQRGPIQMLLDYGTARLSTVGNEHSYRFSFVSRPAEQFRVVNEVVQAVDEERPTKYLR